MNNTIREFLIVLLSLLALALTISLLIIGYTFFSYIILKENIQQCNNRIVPFGEFLVDNSKYKPVLVDHHINCCSYNTRIIKGVWEKVYECKALEDIQK